MKKITAIIVLAACLMITGTSQAQTKSGYISVDNMVLLMPETAKIDSLLGIFERDSLNPRFTYIVGEYQRKDSMYRDTVRTPGAVRKTLEPELQNLIYEIQNWDAIKQQVIQNKQNALLEPIYSKVVKAIQDVAKEKGYGYVYSREALLVAPPADDILPLVAAKLNVKLPPPGTGGARPPAGRPNN
jgi:outer membrane protein